MNDNSLSTTHQRLFSSLIQVMENQLYDIESFLKRPEHSLVISKWKNNLNISEIIQLRNNMMVCYEKMCLFVQHFKLPEQQHDLRNALETKVSFLWETIEDSKSKRMKGSGEMSPQHQQVLDSFLSDMIITVNEMMNTLSKNQNKGTL